jgi:hypothetical protein
LRRFLLHLLPKGFVRIRYFGFLADCRRSHYCRYASQHWAPFHRRSNRKSPPGNRIRFGAAPGVADPWRSSNDLALLKSNSVLLHCGLLLRHETARPQLENSARFPALRPRPPAPDPIPTSGPLSHRFQPSIPAPTPSRRPLLHFSADPHQLQHFSFAPFNLHKARVRKGTRVIRPQSRIGPGHSRQIQRDISGTVLCSRSHIRSHPVYRVVSYWLGPVSIQKSGCGCRFRQKWTTGCLTSATIAAPSRLRAVI